MMGMDMIPVTTRRPRLDNAYCALGQVPYKVHAPCCGQFVVRRGRILRHHREFYLGLLDWLARARGEDAIVSRALEYSWHIIFGEVPVAPALAECALYQCGGTWQGK